MATYSVTIHLTNTSTPCEGYYIYTGETYNIDDAGYINGVEELHEIGVFGYTFNIDYSGLQTYLFVFVEHCDGHVDPAPDGTIKRQGGYQIELLELGEDCIEIILPTPQPTLTPTPTPTQQSQTPILTLTFLRDPRRFQATLSGAYNYDITINSIYTDGYATNSQNATAVSSAFDVTGLYTMNQGFLINNWSPQSVCGGNGTACWDLAYYYTVYNVILEIEGVTYNPVSNGDTITYNGYSFIVSFPPKTPFSVPNVTFTPTTTPTITPTPTVTSGLPPSQTPTNTPTSTITPSITPTGSITPTITPTITRTPTNTPTPTKTPTPTPTVPVANPILIDVVPQIFSNNTLTTIGGTVYGPTYHTMSFDGEWLRYSDLNCTNTIGQTLKFNNVFIGIVNSGLSFFTSPFYTFDANGAVKVKLTKLSVEILGTIYNITSSGQIITVGGYNYVFTGFGSCVD